jgi:hypothetical protein
MKYTVSVFLIATVLLASTRAAPVPLSDDALLDDDYLEDVVESVVPEVDVDLSDDTRPILRDYNPDEDDDKYCSPWPSCKSAGQNGVSGDVHQQQYENSAGCPVCKERIGGVCQPKVCAQPGKTCQLHSNKKKGLTQGLCG